MTCRTQNAVRRVLREAGEHDHFFEYSDGERLTWMIGRAFELGRATQVRVGRRSMPARRRASLKEREGAKP